MGLYSFYFTYLLFNLFIYFISFISFIFILKTVISQSVDDRTPEELGINLHEDKKSEKEQSRRVINKSRYDSIDCYISLEDDFKVIYKQKHILI